MVGLGCERDIEVCLFAGLRAAWDTGVQASTSSGGVISASVRGGSQLLYALRDVERGCELGLRSVLIGDLGVVSVVDALRRGGELPADLMIKSSVSLPVANPASGRVLTVLGVNTLNLSVDLTLGQIASIRAAVDVPRDCYVERSTTTTSPGPGWCSSRRLRSTGPPPRTPRPRTSCHPRQREVQCSQLARDTPRRGAATWRRPRLSQRTSPTRARDRPRATQALRDRGLLMRTLGLPGNRGGFFVLPSVEGQGSRSWSLAYCTPHDQRQLSVDRSPPPNSSRPAAPQRRATHLTTDPTTSARVAVHGATKAPPACPDHLTLEKTR